MTARLWRRAGVALVVLGVAEALAEALRGVRGADKSDYVGFAAASRLLHAGSRAIYSLPAEAHAQAQLVGHALTIGVEPYVNPPLLAWAVQPIADLPLRTGVAAFLAISLLALAAAVPLLARLLPGPPGPGRLLLAGVAVTLAPALVGFAFVQWGALLLVAAAGALAIAARRDSVLAGVLLSLLLVKPQDVWLVIPALLLSGHRRTLSGMAAGAAVWMASSLAIVGPGGVHDWVRAVLQDGADSAVKAAGIPGLAAQLTGDAGVAFPVAVICAAAGVGLLWALRGRLRADRPLAIALGLALSLLAAPHVFIADLALLAPLVVLLGRRGPAPLLAAGAALQVAGLLGGDVPGPAAHVLLLAVVGGVIVTATLTLARRPSPEGVALGMPRTLVGSA